MKTLLLILSLATLTITSQEVVETQYLFVKNRAAAKQLLDQVNAAYGYPNPATKTWQSVAPIYHATKQWCLIPIDLAAIYAPATKGHMHIKDQVQARISSKDFELVTTPEGVAPKDPFCRVTETIAKQLGFFPTETN